MNPRFEIRQAKRRLGKRRWYVVLLSSNGEIVMRSEELNSLAAAHTNIAATVVAAAKADIVDVTVHVSTPT